MLNLTLTDEQVYTLISQLPKDKKLELLDQLRFEEWLDSPEALQLKTEREKEIAEGKTLTMDQLKDKLMVNGKNI